MEPLRPGDPRTVGPWKILSRIGAGGMGVVYYANRRGQKVALKIMRDLYGTEHNIGRYFARELANLRLVSGPSVAALVDADMEAAPAWIAFEYIDGPNLKVFVDSNGPLLEDAWRKFAASLLKGISEVHARGVIHRDLKPSNIVIASTGPKLIDFGIAQALDDTPFTRTGMIVGTPTWMAPEQIDAMVVGKPADLFAAGSILLYAATGREPWGTGTTKEMQARICRGQPDMGGLSAMQSRLISALLCKDPIKRATAEDAVRVLGGGNYRPGFPWRTVFNWTSAALVLVGLVALMISFYLGWDRLQPAAAQSASMLVTATGAAVPTVEPTAEALPTEELPTEEPSGFICVQLFDDLNGNGVLDAGEGQVKGGVFTITDTSSSNTLGTYTSGEKSEPYCFEKMQPANYRVAVQAPAGYLSTTLLEWDLTLAMGSTANLEFGAQLGGAAPTPTVEPTAEALPTEEPSGFICVQLFDDLNGNGVLDAGEGQVKGGVFTITDTSSSKTLGTYTTGEKPEPYCFEKLQPANYRIALQAPAGYLSTTRVEWDLTLAMGSTANLEFGAQLGGAAPTPTAVAGAAKQPAWLGPLVGALGAMLLLGGAGLAGYLLLTRRR